LDKTSCDKSDNSNPAEVVASWLERVPFEEDEPVFENFHFVIKILIVYYDKRERKIIRILCQGGQNDHKRSHSHSHAQSVLFSTDTEKQEAVDRRIL
jgi:hypothetical protein